MSNRRAREQRQQQRLADAQARLARSEHRNRWLWLGGTAGMLVAAAVVIALAASGGSSGKGPSLTPVAAGKRAAPAAPLPPGGHVPRQIEADLREGNEVLEGQVEERLAALKGVPVVVNMWASWCPNCKHEFPFFQSLSAGEFKDRVAFLGLDSQDTRSNAESFLRQHPLVYPSIFDETAQQAQSIGAGRGWPTTIYYDHTGQRTFVHEGAYQSEAALGEDIRTYALGH
jgi:cytochrome c biogenesis protein CcmG, thiol:disulfide interchange protein DsbE